MIKVILFLAISTNYYIRKPSFIIFSPWIEKKIWATFEDGFQHVSVHLQDFKQELFTAKTEKELKKDALNLYEKFEPTLFEEKLNQFLNTNL